MLRVTHGTAHHPTDSTPPDGIAADTATVLREFTNRSIAKEGFLPQSLGDRWRDPEAARFFADSKAVFLHLQLPSPLTFTLPQAATKHKEGIGTGQQGATETSSHRI